MSQRNLCQKACPLSLLGVLSLLVFFGPAAAARDALPGAAARLVSTSGSGAGQPRQVAQTRTVNSADDTDDGVCDATHCSLREAINLSQAGDTINFSALFNTPQRIKLTATLPTISKNLTIAGPGSDLLEVRRDSGGAYRILTIDGGATVNISGVTVANGSDSTFPNAGGIDLDSGALTLTGVVVTANVGGGISVQSGTLNVNQSVISFNRGGWGGIVALGGVLTIVDTLIAGNSAAASAGGITTDHATLTLSTSAIVNNRVASGSAAAGGLRLADVTTSTVTNTTISGNSANASGTGGVAAILATAPTTYATVTLTNCTIAGNTGSGAAAIVAQNGSTGVATIHLKNTILNNPALTNLAISNNATIISDGNNLSNDIGSPFLRTTPPADVINTDALLASLDYYGGSTPSHLLLPGSPAIDAGNSIGASATDQRGSARVVGAHVDIGAVEMNPLLVNSAADPGDGVCDATCTLRDAIGAANAAGVLKDVQFDAAVFSSAQRINLASALPNLTGIVNVAGPGSDLLEVRRDSGGDYTIFDAQGGAQTSISGMTIANGIGTAAGGIVNSASTMHLSRVLVTENHSTGGFSGAGIANQNGGALAIADSVVSFNQNASFGGGGISNSLASMTVSNTLVTRNSAATGGGGLFNVSGRLRVTTSTISNNSVPSAGASAGGLYIDDYDANADVTLVNTTLSGNRASATSASAVLNNGISSVSVSNLALSFCTVADSTGPAASAVMTNSAGSNMKANTTLDNSIFDSSPASLGLAGAGAKVVSNGNNLSSDSGSGLLSAGFDLSNADPKLARLANYGGPTPTHALLPGSPAIDAGNDADTPYDDQRGELRSAGAHVDIGAVEMNPRLVNSVADPGDGSCDATCTLRDAVLAANAAGGPLVDIEFDPTVFGASQTINLAAALPDITGSVVMIGTGANRLTVRRNVTDLFSILTVDAGAKVSLYGLTISNGKTPFNGFGGGIHSDGAVTLARVAIDGNQADNAGGGIFNDGTLTIDDSTISNNTANDGAALYNSPGFAHLTNTTISGNNARSDFTGGVTNLSFGAGPAVVSLLNSTISNNSGGTEGGIYTSYDAVTRLKNTIVAGNSFPNITGGGAGSIVSLGNNLSDDSGAGFLTNTGDLTNLPALLAPLGSYGGPTKTQDPLAGSPAVFAGAQTAAPAFDQRGYPRAAASVDIGAVDSDVLFRDGFDPL